MFLCNPNGAPLLYQVICFLGTESFLDLNPLDLAVDDFLDELVCLLRAELVVVDLALVGPDHVRLLGASRILDGVLAVVIEAFLDLFVLADCVFHGDEPLGRGDLGLIEEAGLAAVVVGFLEGFEEVLS